MLYYAVIALHIIVCIFLVLVVLLQSGKGADLAGAFGGGSTQTAFGSRGSASFLTRITTVAAITFMLTSLGLSMMGERRISAADRSVFDERAVTPVQGQETGADASTSPLTPAQIEEEMRRIEERLQATPADSIAPESTPGE